MDNQPESLFEHPLPQLAGNSKLGVLIYSRTCVLAAMLNAERQSSKRWGNLYPLLVSADMTIAHGVRNRIQNMHHNLKPNGWEGNTNRWEDYHAVY